MSKNNIFNIRIKYEDIPIIDTETKGINGLKKVFDDIKDKIG